METRIDFVQWLQTDMAVNILNRLDDPADLIRASSVSHFWHNFVVANGLSKQLCLRAFPQLTSVARVIEPNGEMKSLEDVETRSYLGWESLLRDHRAYAALILAVKAFPVNNCIAYAIGASSTDRYPEESIVNTLDPRDRILWRASYWSSKGQSNPTVPETLIYKLRTDFCVITEINIQPFQGYFRYGNPIYSAKSVRFRFGHTKTPWDLGSDLKELPLQQCADDKFRWTYTSQEFPMVQENRLQNFKLPAPVLCIGGFLLIELLGRVQRDPIDCQFYICSGNTEEMA